MVLIHRFVVIQQSSRIFFTFLISVSRTISLKDVVDALSSVSLKWVYNSHTCRQEDEESISKSNVNEWQLLCIWMMMMANCSKFRSFYFLICDSWNVYAGQHSESLQMTESARRCIILNRKTALLATVVTLWMNSPLTFFS